MAPDPPTPMQSSRPNPEVRTARNWYIWLWVSPVLTVPSFLYLILMYPSDRRGISFLMTILPVLGSALWHLILLIPAIMGKSDFIHWHGRQALFLAGLRTLMMVVIVRIAISQSIGSLIFICSGILILFAIWIAGNVWGQKNTQRGDCWLMRVTGHGEGLPLSPQLTYASTVDSPSIVVQGEPVDIDGLVETFRFAPDTEKRRLALAELERLGFVEPIS